MSDNNYSIVLNLASKHNVQGQNQYNENNRGIGIRRALENNRSIGGGYYKNSINNDSLYLDYNKSWPFHAGLDFSPGISAGLVTGYRPYPVPYLTPTLGIGLRGYNATLRYIPKIDGVTPEVIGLQFEIPIGKRKK